MSSEFKNTGLLGGRVAEVEQNGVRILKLRGCILRGSKKCPFDNFFGQCEPIDPYEIKLEEGAPLEFSKNVYCGHSG